MFRIRPLFFLAALIFTYSMHLQSAFSQECQNYSVDHPEWVLCEDWESGNIRRDIWNDGDIGTVNNLTAEEIFEGSYALEMTHPAGGSGGWLNSIGNFPDNGYHGPIGNGHKKLFFRWYVKFSSNWPDPTTGQNTKIAGFDIKPEGLTNFWALDKEGHRGAGYRPDGETTLGGSRIVNGPGAIHFYVYHPKMMLDRWSNEGTLYCYYYGNSRPVHPDWHYEYPLTLVGSGDYYCDWSLGEEYANLKRNAPDPYLASEEERTIGRDVWRCVEQELKVNDPGMENGYQRLYLDNKLVGEWKGASWSLGSTVPKIAAIQLTASSKDDHGLVYSYYDNIVLSTERVGCLNMDEPYTPPEPVGGSTDSGSEFSDGTNGNNIQVSSGCGEIDDSTRMSVFLTLILCIIILLIFIRKTA